MAADYTNTPRWSEGSTGSVLIPEYWIPALEPDLPLLTFWEQFLGKTWGNVEVSGEGMGDLFKASYITDVAAQTTPLTEGTAIATGNSTGLAQATGTLREYGYAERISGFANWLSNVDLMSASGLTIARNAMITRNALIGAVFNSTTNGFAVTDATTVNTISTTDAGTTGVSQMLPLHVTKMVSVLRQKGIAPYSDGLYRCIGSPGIFDGIKGQAQVYSSAAQLGISGVYSMGEVAVYNGVLFIEEFGPHRVSTLNAAGTASKSTIFGMNAVIGYDNFYRPDLIKFYADDQNDFGRTGKLGWYACGGWVRPVDSAANGRSWNIYSSQ